MPHITTPQMIIILCSTHRRNRNHTHSIILATGALLPHQPREVLHETLDFGDDCCVVSCFLHLKQCPADLLRKGLDGLHSCALYRDGGQGEELCFVAIGFTGYVPLVLCAMNGSRSWWMFLWISV